MSSEQAKERPTLTLAERQRTLADNIITLLPIERKLTLPQKMGRLLGRRIVEPHEIPKFTSTLSTSYFPAGELQISDQTWRLRKRLVVTQDAYVPGVAIDIIGKMKRLGVRMSLDDTEILRTLAVVHIHNRLEPENLELFVCRNILEGRSFDGPLQQIEGPLDVYWGRINADILSAKETGFRFSPEK